MTDEAPTYHHGDLKNALVAAAIELIAARGAEAFSLREAARHVGVTPSAVYRHFEDKDALLAAVASQGFARLAEAMDGAVAAVAAKDPPGQRAQRELEAIGVSYVTFALEHPATFRVMFGPYGAASPHAVRGTGPSGLDPYELLQRGLDRLAAAGLVSGETREDAEVGLWSTVHGYASLLVDGPFRHEPSAATPDAIRSVVAASIDGLVARS